MPQGANHAIRVRNGDNSELADVRRGFANQQAAKRGPWCYFSRVHAFTAHDTPVYLSVYATNGELANLHRQPVSERWALEDLE
jgi:hypothetical protein